MAIETEMFRLLFYVMKGVHLMVKRLSFFEYGAEDIIWYDKEDIKKIESILKKYPYHVYNWYSDQIDLYTITGEEILFVLQGDTPNGTYSAKTIEAYQIIDQDCIFGNNIMVEFASGKNGFNDTYFDKIAKSVLLNRHFLENVKSDGNDRGPAY